MEKIKLMICIGLIFTFIGYSNAVESAQKGILKIKGLHIGMNIDEVPAILKEKLPEINVSDVEKITYKEDCSYRVLVNRITVYFGESEICADKNKKVILISFAPRIVDKLFNVEDMNAESFVQEFVNSYNILSMKPELIENAWKWVYTSPAGYKVTISERKTLKIEKIASEGERKFD